MASEQLSQTSPFSDSLQLDAVDPFISETFFNIIKIAYTDDKVADLEIPFNIAVSTFIRQHFSTKLAQLLLNRCLDAFIGVTLEPLAAMDVDVIFSGSAFEMGTYFCQCSDTDIMIFDKTLTASFKSVTDEDDDRQEVRGRQMETLTVVHDRKYPGYVRLLLMSSGRLEEIDHQFLISRLCKRDTF